MAYTKHTWASGPSGNTPITHTKLNEIETGIYNAHTGYTSAQSTATTANNRSITNAGNITSLTSRVSSAENSLKTLSEDTQYLSNRVDTLSTTVSGNSSSITNAHSAISTMNATLANLGNTVTDHDNRIATLEESGGGGGGSASLTISQYVNPADITIANNAWAVSPRLVNRPGASNSGDITVTDQTTNGRGVLQVLNTGIYLMSMTVVDTQNPSGQANFLCNTVKVNDANASSVVSVLARFQHYASNQGSGTAAMQLSAGDYVSFQFRQNATGGNMVLPNGVTAIQNNSYVGLALTFIKVG